MLTFSIIQNCCIMSCFYIFYNMLKNQKIMYTFLVYIKPYYITWKNKSIILQWRILYDKAFIEQALLMWLNSGKICRVICKKTRSELINLYIGARYEMIKQVEPKRESTTLVEYRFEWARIKKELARVTEQREILKKAGIFSQSPPML